jgi:hypothetical protein
MGPKKPNPLFVEKIFVRQGTYRTQIHHIAGKLVLERIPRQDGNFLMGAASKHQQFPRADYLPHKPHTTGAHNAPIYKKPHIAQVMASAMERIDLCPPLLLAIPIMIILQSAFPRFVANGTVDRMPQEQVLFHHGPGLLDFFGLGNNDGAVHGWRVAGRLEFGEHGDVAGLRVPFADLDQTHPATAHHGKPRMKAKMGNLHPGQRCRLNAVKLLAFGQLNFPIIDNHRRHSRS